jgi:hypothetical protein
MFYIYYVNLNLFPSIKGAYPAKNLAEILMPPDIVQELVTIRNMN